MTFHVGQKVTLKRPQPWNDLMADERGPVFGEIYTIRGTEISRASLYLWFAELRNPPHYNDYVGIPECIFLARRFRPVVENKTSIEIFRAMLNPSKVDA